MADSTGQKPGQPGLGWGELLDQLVAEHGTWSAVAWRLIGTAEGDDVASVERALRRLRARGQKDGGVWGQRVLRTFGVPAAIDARLRWMGLYHSPFNDLPVSLCYDQLRLWDRPPVSESRARVWVQLGLTSSALRSRRFPEAAAHLRAAAAVAEGDAAPLEVALVEAYLASRLDQPPMLARAEALLPHVRDPADAACFAARLADQQAYQLNRRGEHAAALALYQALPAQDLHPFASYRRDSGLAYGHHRAGDRDLALRLAQQACEHAGDGGYVRLRVMGLLMVHRIAPDPAVLARALAMATRLEDTELLARIARRAAPG